jgi:hypothetical protein
LVKQTRDEVDKECQAHIMLYDNKTNTNNQANSELVLSVITASVDIDKICA